MHIKKRIIIPVIILLLLASCTAFFFYESNSITQKYYAGADPMVEAYQANQSVFHHAVDTFSDLTDRGNIRVEVDPMDYIRSYYTHASELDTVAILSDAALTDAEQAAIYEAVSAVMAVTDIHAVSMTVSEEYGMVIDFIFCYDYGIYAEFYYFEQAQERFPHSPAHPKDIQKIDSNWYACLSTDTFMAG